MDHAQQVGGCQTDADGFELLGEGCAVVQPRGYLTKDPNRQSYRVVEDEFGRNDSSGSLLDSVHNTLYHG